LINRGKNKSISRCPKKK